MVSSINNTISALNAFGKGIDVKANNIANVNTDNFKKSRAVNMEGENGDIKVEISKVDDGLPELTPEEAAADPRPSNVDLAEEIPGMMIDQRGFEANTKVIQTKDEMLGTVLDIVA